MVNFRLVKNPPTMQETRVQSLGWEDSPGERNGYPLQYSGLENFMVETMEAVSFIGKYIDSQVSA